MSSFRASLPAHLRGCVPLYTYRHYPAYLPIGETRKKERSYSSFEHLHKRTNPACGCWNTSLADCCTGDADRHTEQQTKPAICADPIPKKTPVKDGDLLQCTSEKTVYLIANQTRRPFAHVTAFARMGFEFTDVKQIDVKDCDARLWWVA